MNFAILWLFMARLSYKVKTLLKQTKMDWLFTKVFSAKFGGVAFFGGTKESKQSPEYFSLICKSFLSPKFPTIAIW